MAHRRSRPAGTHAASLTLLGLLIAGAAAAQPSIWRVGSGMGCNAINLDFALLLARSNSADDEIRLNANLSGVAMDLGDWDDDQYGELTIRGGFANCAANTPTSTTTLTAQAAGSSPVLDVVLSGNDPATIRLERLILQGAASGVSPLVVANGSNVVIDLVNTDVLGATSSGIEVLGGARVDLDPLSEVSDSGSLTLDGGGVYCTGSGSEVFLAGDLVLNQGARGGGAFLESGCRLYLLDDAFIGANQAVRGGGVAVEGGGSLERPISFVNDFGVQISGNSAEIDGGGLWVANGGSAQLWDTWLRGNEAIERGGGIFATGSGSSVIVRRRSTTCFSEPRCSWIEDNQITSDVEDGFGTAVFVDAGADVVVVQTFIEGHAGPPVSRLLYVAGSGSTLLLEGVQLYANDTQTLFSAEAGASITAAFVSAAGNTWGGGEPSAAIAAFASTRIDVRSSALADHGIWNDGPGNTIDLDCVIADSLAGATVATASIVADPLFLAPEAGDLRISAASPGVDYCDDSVYAPIADDLALNPRGVDTPGVPNQSGTFDLGAYEVGSLLFADGFESGDVSAWSSTSP
ncbi:MAG: hypothetical protein DWQ36_23235 [Acidobacteria bacterium]|nr:MAG: hypothetical protein DWQ30_19515 [Acidobacteriota bacterium]REK00329.1 MAG: hypothetical protein DWQ36_23235 [Acidobacteriota bacterium]